MSAFEEFGLHPSIIRAIEDLDWTLPTPVQAEAVPLILGGGDVCICAETGTGKTAAFGLASIQQIYEYRTTTTSSKKKNNTTKVHGGDGGTMSGKIPSPYCIILEPTIPLCEQTCKCMKEYSKDLQPPVNIHLYAADARGPKGVQPDAIVGTPQKIKNSILRGQLDLSRVFMLILDEADDLIKNDQDKILAKLCDDIKSHGERDASSEGPRVQVVLTSATLASEEVQDMIKLLTLNAQWVDTRGSILGNVLPDTVHHAIYRIHPQDDIKPIKKGCKNPNASVPTDGIYALDHTTGIQSEEIKLKKPKIAVKIADAYKMDRCMVFCRTNLDCDNLESYFHSLDGIPP
ncbi:ATP-dependent RNA helicase ddx1 [Perkinsus olseni]|nr:ATP-dependent RNA helicase ddx1 [Perkinsus olseni]KAF4649525.1 ATP-dependent RNA helicase ddx1 [Perkinsus olseni]